MRYLLDTHTLSWAINDPKKLSGPSLQLLENLENQLMVSAVSLWEMSIKHKLGKWPEVAPFMDEQLYVQFLEQLGAEELPVYSGHARLAGQFNMNHKDPFDRLLAAQAVLESIPILSKDAVLDQFPIVRVW
jgi:PIN domain nuclease of toxin-antitoxin system